MMQFELCHVTFSTIDVLPPLLHELKSLSDSKIPSIVLGLRYDRSQISCDEIHPFVHRHRLTLLTRIISEKQIFILKLIRYFEFVIRSFFFLYRCPVKIYVAHDLTALIPAFLAAKLLSRRIIYNAHELWTEREDASTPLPRVWKWLDTYFCRCVDLVITPDEYRSKIYYSEYRTKKFPVTIHNVPPYKKYVAGKFLLHERLNLPTDDHSKIVLYQGLFHKSRCLKELVHSMATVSKEILLILIGRGDDHYTKEITKKITALDLGNRVFIIDRIPYENLFEYTCSADAGILLYRNDSRNNYYCAPNKLYEYFQAGLPVIASDFPSLHNIVEGNHAGLCVVPDDPEQIAFTINKLFSDQSDYLRMHKRVLQLASDKFNWEIEFPFLLRTYREFAITSMNQYSHDTFYAI